MRVGSRIAGVLTAAAVLISAGSAAAAQMVLTISGTVNGTGYDTIGLLGPKSGTLSGDITLRLFYDPELGRRTVAAGAGYEDINGGPGYFPYTYASPVTSVSVTANGQQTSFATPYSAYITTYGGNFLNFYAAGDIPPGGFSRPFTSGGLTGSAAPSSLTQAYSAAMACVNCASFQITEPVPGQSYSYATMAQIDVTGLSIAAAAAPAPEPAAWALMIAGFGLAGAALRRRRAALAG